MILFIDTHSELITVALKNNDNIYIKTHESFSEHSKYILTLINEIFEENKLDLKKLKKIIVVNGPGSFTGIRIGLTIAKLLSYTLKTDINTISSLTAYLISEQTLCDKMAVIKDNKGFYISVFSKDNEIIKTEEYKEENPYDYYEVNYDLDIEKIIDYCKNLKSENCHNIKANYIKKIEVEK